MIDYEARKRKMGKRIQQERERLHLSRKELLSKIFMSESSHKTLAAWENGNRLPDLDSLARMAELFCCDIGYLLCDYDEHTRDIADACEVTGLSESSIQILRNYKKWGFTEEPKVIDFLLLDTAKRKSTHHFRPILNLLNFFFSYKNDSKTRKSVSIHGNVYDDNSTDGMIGANSIAINSRVIENAVLMEIQQALVGLKRDCVQISEEGNDKKHG